MPRSVRLLLRDASAVLRPLGEGRFRCAPHTAALEPIPFFVRSWVDHFARLTTNLRERCGPAVVRILTMKLRPTLRPSPPTENT
jgi:hypothetical protein